MIKYCVAYRFKSGKVQTQSFDSMTARSLWIIAMPFEIVKEWEEDDSSDVEYAGPLSSRNSDW